MIPPSLVLTNPPPGRPRSLFAVMTLQFYQSRLVTRLFPLVDCFHHRFPPIYYYSLY